MASYQKYCKTARMILKKSLEEEHANSETNRTKTKSSVLNGGLSVLFRYSTVLNDETTPLI